MESDTPRRTRSDWLVVAFTLLLGSAETASSGVGWPVLRGASALAIAWLLLQRRSAPLMVLLATAGINAAANIVLRIADHGVLLTGVAVTVAIYSLARWESGRRLVAGSGVVAAHALVLLVVDPNSSLSSVVLFHGGPALLAYVARTGATTTRTSRVVRVTAVAIVLGGVFVTTQQTFIADQLSSYATHTRSPAVPAAWQVEAPVLRSTAEASRGTHTPDGAVHHTVDYPHQLLAALSSPTSSVEANVTVIDGTAYLQHDPRDAVGMPLLEFLEYAALADFPIIKLDLKRDRVDTIIGDVRKAIDRFELDPRHLQFNADVFRGPGVRNDVFGARSDKSFTDRMYNLIVMELETSDLGHLAEHFPESTIVISAMTPTGPHHEGYSTHHLARFNDIARKIRRVNPDQPVAFALRGDLAAQSGPEFLAGLTAVENSHITAWWSTNPRPAPGEIEELRDRGVTFFDRGREADD